MGKVLRLPGALNPPSIHKHSFLEVSGRLLCSSDATTAIAVNEPTHGRRTARSDNQSPSENPDRPRDFGSGATLPNADCPERRRERMLDRATRCFGASLTCQRPRPRVFYQATYQGQRMPSRRQLVIGSSAVIVFAPFAAFPQGSVAKIPRIGYLQASMPQNGSSNFLEDFRQGLRELGYVEGKNV